jgi:hypothetical protein
MGGIRDRRRQAAMRSATIMSPKKEKDYYSDLMLMGHRFRYIQNPFTERPWTVPIGVMDVFR